MRNQKGESRAYFLPAAQFGDSNDLESNLSRLFDRACFMNPLDSSLPTPKELQTRFLCPFFFQRDRVREAGEELKRVSIAGRGGKLLNIWEPAQPHDLYLEELLVHVRDYLFRGFQEGECGYFQLAEQVSNAFFNKLEVEMSGGENIPLRLVPKIRAELFLFRVGVGIFSLALSPRHDGLTCDEILGLNYGLSQLRKQVASRVRVTQQSRITPIEEHAHISLIDQFLGRRDDAFTLGELVAKLLQPIKRFSRERHLRSGAREEAEGAQGFFEDSVELAQEQLSVYSSVQFGAEVDFEVPDVISILAVFLSKLAQVEEPGHAGSPRSIVGIPNCALNRKQWAAVGLLGAAHIVADQEPPEHPFNSARMGRAFMKYFIPYLLASHQRLALQGIIHDADRKTFSGAGSKPSHRDELRQCLLEFALRGYFTQVSSRDVLHRYYHISQQGLDVRNVLEDTRRAVGDIEAKETAKLMTEHLGAIRGVQEKVEVLEFAVIAISVWAVLESLTPGLREWEPKPPWHFIAFVAAIACSFLLRAIIDLWNKDNRGN
jgi:hypothetical protein